MCGRFYVDEDTFQEVEKAVRAVDIRMQKMRTGDIYPSQSAGVLTGKTSVPRLEQMNWGFLQYQKKGLLINARAETVLERKMFRDSVLHRRCVIPAKHFYEWDASKNKVTFFREDGPVLFMAGFYNMVQDQMRFIILTTQANASVRPVHDRMPLILEEGELHDWMYEDSSIGAVLRKTPPVLGRMQEYEQQSLF